MATELLLAITAGAFTLKFTVLTLLTWKPKVKKTITIFTIGGMLLEIGLFVGLTLK